MPAPNARCTPAQSMQSETLCVAQSQRSWPHAAPQSKQHASSITAAAADADDGCAACVAAGVAASLDIASGLLLLGLAASAGAARLIATLPLHTVLLAPLDP
mmetsp:Transcript_23585/g.61553  ORF Transcript_23585/g.61553 Transcript_23585/m.61553 type:complete len:102 (-) Transcript_23585:108-413(-)